jgi:hypothetical protein
MEAIRRVSQLATRYSLLYQAIKCQKQTHTLELPAMHRDVGSYGTRNVVGIGIISYWERPTDCIVLILCLSSSFRGDPLFLGHSPSPAFTAVVEKTHVRQGANKWCLQSNTG